MVLSRLRKLDVPEGPAQYLAEGDGDQRVQKPPVGEHVEGVRSTFDAQGTLTTAAGPSPAIHTEAMRIWG